MKASGCSNYIHSPVCMFVVFWGFFTTTYHCCHSGPDRIRPCVTPATLKHSSIYPAVQFTITNIPLSLLLHPYHIKFIPSCCYLRNDTKEGTKRVVREFHTLLKSSAADQVPPLAGCCICLSGINSPEGTERRLSHTTLKIETLGPHLQGALQPSLCVPRAMMLGLQEDQRTPGTPQADSGAPLLPVCFNLACTSHLLRVTQHS